MRTLLLALTATAALSAAQSHGNGHGHGNGNGHGHGNGHGNGHGHGGGGGGNALLLPDLQAVADEEQDLVHGWTLDQFLMPGSTLLRLSTSIANIGTGPMEIRGQDPNADGSQPVVQRIYREDGTFEEHLAGTFFFHPEHDHIHFNDFVTYRIRAANADGSVGAILRSGAKTSFCLADFYEFDEDMPNYDPEGPYGDCSQVQGISVGWADVYVQSLPDQWIDVSGLADGSYFIEVLADEDNLLQESDETNNAVLVPITLHIPRGSITGCVFDDRDGNGDLRAGMEGDLAGVRVYIDANHNKQYDQGSRRVENSTSLSIPDELSAYSDLDMHGIEGVVTDVEVEVNITHPRPKDLAIFLLSPSGRRVQLIDSKGGGSNIHATFADNGGPITGSVSGRLKPTEPLSEFVGAYGDGHWRLEVSDRKAAKTGVLTSWAVTVHYAEQSTLSDARGCYAFTELPLVHYGVGVVPPPLMGWRQTLPVANDLHHIDLSDGSEAKCQNFGLTQSAEVSGIVGNDLNGNGVKNVGDGAMSGWTVWRDLDNDGVFDHGMAQVLTNNVPVAIPDTQIGVSTIDATALSGSVSQLRVTMNIEHTFTPDLTIHLISPQGKRVKLFARLGTQGENFEGTTIIDQHDHHYLMMHPELVLPGYHGHATPITDGEAPYVGAFTSQEPLRPIWGEPVNGIWRLECKDNEELDEGTILSWSLEFAFAEPNVVTGEGGQWRFTDLVPGTHRFRAVPQPGWTSTVPLVSVPVAAGQVIPGFFLGQRHP